MKYFVCIKESYYNRSTRELFYQRLMQKRVGKGKYILHKNNMPKTEKVSSLLNSNDNMFNGYIIEFVDKIAFSKFKLSYKSLLNPSLDKPSERIVSCKSFCVEDDYDIILDDIYNRYKILENRKDNIASILYTINSLVSTVKSLKCVAETALSDNIQIETNNDLDLEFDKNIIQRIINSSNGMEKSMEENDINFLHKTSTYYGGLIKEDILYEYHKRMTDIKLEAKSLFSSIVDLEIPD